MSLSGHCCLLAPLWQLQRLELLTLFNCMLGFQPSTTSCIICHNGHCALRMAQIKSAVAWANGNRGAIALCGTVVTALSSATYGAYWLYDTKSQLAHEVENAQRDCKLGRAMYIKSDTAAATRFMANAKRAADAARLRANSLPSFLRSPVLSAASTSYPQLLHLSAHTSYHCAVMSIRNKKFDEALQLLTSSIELRESAASVKGSGFIKSEHARAKTRQGDLCSWCDVGAAKKIYASVIEGDESAQDFFTVRAHNNFGILWYALGSDDRAATCFRDAATVADKLSALDDARVMELQRADATVTEQLISLGSGQEVPYAKLCAELKSLLTAYLSSCGVVDVAHLPPADESARALEVAERLKLTWRKRLTARVNLLQVLTTTWPPPNSQDVADILDQLQRDMPIAQAVLHAPYLALDDRWLSKGGSVRVAYAVAAGVTHLLERGAICNPVDVAAAKALVISALKLGEDRRPDASATQQGILEYHHAAFLLLDNKPEDASPFVHASIANHGAYGAKHVTQRDIRLQLQSRLLSDPPLSMRELNALIFNRNGMSDERLRDVTMQSPHYPVLLRRAAMGGADGRAYLRGQLETAAVVAEVLNAGQLIRGLERLLQKVNAARRPRLERRPAQLLAG